MLGGHDAIADKDRRHATLQKGSATRLGQGRGAGARDAGVGATGARAPGARLQGKGGGRGKGRAL